MRLEHIRSVMVVDDDPRIVEQLTGILKNEGLRVKSASNCLDALHIVSDDVPDLFLIDLAMPTIRGDRLCRILRNRPPLEGSFRVILSPMTNACEIDLEAMGAHACISKEPRRLMPTNIIKVLHQLDQGHGQGKPHEENNSECQDKALKENLQHAQKMEAVGTLAGGIAHDFNNILQTILGYAQLSLIESEIPPAIINNLEEIQTSAQNATSLIRRLLLFCRKVDSQHRPVDLNRQISHVAHMLERTIPRMIQIELQLDEDLRPIKADGNLLEQILMNLGVNARDAMPDGGHLSFRTRNKNLDQTFCDKHPGASPGQHVQLMVSDTGIGMTDNIRENIFDPFFTTKKNGQGTGLGLAMVYGIVKEHAGFINCESKLGQGTEFTLYFPAIHSIGEDEVTYPEDRENLSGGTETILLVDDDEGIRNFGQQILQKFGYTVISAQSGEEALDIFSRNAARIDLVIIDLSMPGMGGLKCIEFLREIRPDCRIIICSGYAAKDQVISALEAGAQEFVPKPWAIRDLLPKIHQVINIS